MAKYRAKADLFVDGVFIKPGESFSSERTPGKNWDPVDAAAKAAYRAQFGGAAAAPAEGEDAPPARKAPARKPAKKGGKAKAKPPAGDHSGGDAA